MRTSFYFVLWIGLYAIFDVINIPFLENNAFIAAFILVIIISNMVNKSMAADIAADRRMSMLRLYDEVYTNAIEKYRRKLLYNLILFIFLSVYFVITFVWIIVMISGRNIFDNLFELFIFGACSFYYVYRTAKIGNNYFSLRAMSSLSEFFPGIEDDPAYLQFCSERSVRTFPQIMQTEHTPGKAYRISNMVFAVISILIGVWFLKMTLPFIVTFSFQNFYSVIMALYGALALQAGVKDLMDLSR